MKIIKKLVYLFVILISVNKLNAQPQQAPVQTGPCSGNNALPCQYTPNWDWIDPAFTNWQAYIGSNTVPMGSPFTANTNTNDMVKVIDGLDYLPQQGWKLFAKDFGCIGQQAVTNATPYFILYNKYKSVIRVFLYLGNTNPFINRASVILKWSGNNGATINNSLFTFSNDYAKANNTYPINNNSEKHVNYLNQVTNSGGWIVTEYLVNFDPNTVNSPGNFQRIDFDFNVSSNAAISLSGDFNFSTESATPKNPDPPVVQSNPNLLDYVLTAKSFLGKAPKKSEIQAGFTQMSTNVNNINEQFCTKFTNNLYNANQGLQNGKFKDFLLGAADVAEGIGGGLGVAASVLELFMGKSNSAAAASTESYIQPTISKGTIKLNGTIVTQSNPLSISLQLPGTSHKFGNGQINCTDLPIYDCPLGVISLQEAPTIEVKTWTAPEKVGQYNCQIDFQTPIQGCSPSIANNQIVVGNQNGSPIYRRSSTCLVNYPSKTIKSFKVTGDIKLALNDAVGVNILSTQAALVFEIKDNAGTAAFDLLKTSEPTPASCCNPTNLLPASNFFCTYIWTPGPSQTGIILSSSNIYTQSQGYENYTKDLLNKGILKLISFDNVKGLHKFQTPFVDISKFKNTAITLDGDVNVYLKLFITMKPISSSDDPTPIVFVATYDIPSNKIISVTGSSPFPMTCAQQVEIDDNELGQAYVSTVYTNTTITGNKITIKQNADLYAAPNAGNVEFEAYEEIKLTSDFTAQMQGPNGTFRAYINPNTGGCATSANALQIQNFFSNCTTSALDRLAQHPNNGNSEDIKVAGIVNDFNTLKMYVAPNPNNGNFKLIFNRNIQNGTVKIINTMGQEVYRKEIEGESGVFELNVAEYLKQGAYYITWNNTKFVLNQRFIID